VVTLLQAIREELVPVIIVVSLLAMYGVITLTRQDGAPDDLRQLVGIVVAFYFAKGAVTSTSREVRTTAAAISAASQSSTNGH
jgi:hypothetical protein